MSKNSIPLFEILKTIRIAGRNEVTSAASYRQRFAEHINSVESDVEKILEFETKKAEQNAFIIVNKSNGTLDIFRGKDVVAEFPVGVGKTVGDDLNTAVYTWGVGFSDYGTTTPSGQFSTQSPYQKIILNRKDYEDGKGLNLLLLNGVQHPVGYKGYSSIALHQVSQNHPERLDIIKNQAGRKSVSTGCINVLPNDFHKISDEIRSSGTRFYILPEDEGNKLELVSLPNGLWFKTRYADEKKENEFILAMRKLFGL